MEFDLTSVLFITITLGIFYVPLLIHNNNKKKNIRLKLNSFLDFAAKANLQIADFEVLRESIIGIDNTNQTVLFGSSSGPGDYQMVNIKDLLICKKIEKSRSVKLKSGSINVVDLLALDFVPKEKSQVIKRMTFYDSSTGLQILDEIALTTKWHKRIQNLVR